MSVDAGLRNFTPDGIPAVGFDPSVDGLYWYAGQGYGIQIAPALARLAAADLLGRSAPPEVAATGLDPAVFFPSRFRARDVAG